MAKTKPASPFVGRWRITHMDLWDQDFVDAEVEGHFTFAADGSGEFQFGYVSGVRNAGSPRGTGTRASSGRGRGATKWTRHRAAGGRCSRAVSCTA